MDSGILYGLVTLILLLTFLGAAAWAYSARRQREFDAAACLPLEDHEVQP